jgi:hypothetical protein
MHQHLRILGIILLAFGIFGIVMTIAAFIFFVLTVYLSGDMAHGLDFSFIDYYLSAIVLFTTIVSILQLIAGIGLMKRRPWARVVTIIASILSLPGLKRSIRRKPSTLCLRHRFPYNPSDSQDTLGVFARARSHAFL